jgi:hypothetical protein
MVPQPEGIRDPELPLNMALNLTKFSIGDKKISSDDFGAMGYKIAYPTGVLVDTKEFKVTFLLDSKFRQYKFFYNWVTAFAVEEGSGTSVSVGDKNRLYVDMHLIPLSEFKSDKVINFKFCRCWVDELSSITYDYSNDAKHVECTFSCKYERLELT